MKNALYIVFFAVLFSSCTEDFDIINTNTNEPQSVTGDFLLPTVLLNMADQSVNNSNYIGDIVAQYTANYEFNDLDIYNWTANSSLWGMYSVLQDVKDIENYGIDQNLPNYEAVALILRAYMISLLTDAHGDVPYSEASQGEQGVFAPKYDSQQSIYQGLFADLERANTLITGGTIGGDILFSGDISKWKKFCNSLHIRLLMRTSGVQDVSTKLSQMVNDPATYPVFTSNDDNAIYDYSGDFPDLSPISIGRGREYDYFLAIPTTHLINTLVDHNDPRIDTWLAHQYGTTNYIGTAPGQTLGNIGRPNEFATKDTSFYAEPGKTSGIFMTYSELSFILAEAAERSLINGNAQMYYETGIQASFDQWNTTMPADYLTGNAQYGTDNLEKIATQKWLALYQNSIEAWFDWKRTGRPSFIQAGSGNVNNDVVPVRLIYPSIEQSVNATNYQSAVGNIGGDNINVRVWWDN